MLPHETTPFSLWENLLESPLLFSLALRPRLCSAQQRGFEPFYSRCQADNGWWGLGVPSLLMAQELCPACCWAGPFTPNRCRSGGARGSAPWADEFVAELQGRGSPCWCPAVPVLSLCPRAGFTAGSVLLSRAGGSALPPFIYLFTLQLLLISDGKWVQVAAVSLYSSIWPQDS